MKDSEFVKAMLFIGIPTKGILTGVTIFAMPLILSRLQYAQEDAGQIVMLYSGGVLISSAYASRMVDRLGRTSGVLFLGALGSGIGLILISLVGWNTLATGNLAYLGVGVLMMGMALLGLAHGLILFDWAAPCPKRSRIRWQNCSQRRRGSSSAVIKVFL